MKLKTMKNIINDMQDVVKTHRYLEKVEIFEVKMKSMRHQMAEMDLKELKMDELEKDISEYIALRKETEEELTKAMVSNSKENLDERVKLKPRLSEILTELETKEAELILIKEEYQKIKALLTDTTAATESFIEKNKKFYEQYCNATVPYDEVVKVFAETVTKICEGIAEDYAASKTRSLVFYKKNGILETIIDIDKDTFDVSINTIENVVNIGKYDGIKGKGQAPKIIGSGPNFSSIQWKEKYGYSNDLLVDLYNEIHSYKQSLESDGDNMASVHRLNREVQMKLQAQQI
ncbi:hypothetical protein MZM54_04960 [[Brevibacterium] frigoritolerans]|nr:hypothetical protein [Peribacillus frigoritolerans]